MEQLRVAIIGVGQIAQRGHLPGYSRAGAKVVALCDSNNPQLSDIAAQFNVPRYYRDWHEMLAAGGFEAVSVCTPPALHAEMVVESARRGYNVLVEKPMAVTLEECDRMIDASEGAGTLLMVSHNQRFMAANRLAKEILASGYLGRAYLVHAVFGHPGPEAWSPGQQWYFRPDMAGRGVVADLGFHKLDLMRWLLGQEIVQISAFVSTFEKATSLEDTAVCAMRFADGAMGTLSVSWVFRPDWENSVVVRCERGVLRIPTEHSDPLRVLRCESGGATTESVHHSTDDDPSGWFGALGAFVRAVVHQQPSPVPGSEGRAALAAVLAACEAASHGTVVELDH